MNPEHAAEHAFAHAHGFYRRQLWWIETIEIHRGHYYRYHVAGTNGMKQDEPISWRVPDLRGAYAFRLREITYERA
jgi:hypothetical protein